MTSLTASHRASSTALTFCALMFVALNLRPALTSVSPILLIIADSLSLSSFEMGVLTTLPVFFLGLAAPLAPWAASRIGIDRTVLAAVVLLALALLVRPYTGTAGLFIGTMIAGGCIGVMGVLLPGIVKRDFPHKASLLTGLYTAMLCAGASVAAGLTEPLRMGLDDQWRPALALWLVPAAIAAVFWWAQLGPKHVPAERRGKPPSLYRDPVAWQVTLFMGLQSSIAYTVFGWLPTILHDRGMSTVAAGLALSISIITQVSTAIAAPWISSLMRDQRVMIALSVLLTAVGLGACIYLPLEGIWFWIVVLGLGQGGAFAMALTLIAVRARNTETAAKLSSMAQGVGYILAAIGPLLVGILHDVFDGWEPTGILLGLIALAALCFGLAAGRNRFVVDTY